MKFIIRGKNVGFQKKDSKEIWNQKGKKDDSNESENRVSERGKDNSMGRGEKAHDKVEITQSVEFSGRKPVEVLKTTLGEEERIEVVRKRLKTLPQYMCSTCVIGPECPEFKEGNVCAFNEVFDSFDTREVSGVLALMSEVLDSNKKRWMRSCTIETVSGGGVPDKNTTKLSEIVMDQGKTLIQLQNEMNRITLKTEIHGNSNTVKEVRGGILSQLFATPNELPPKKEEVTVSVNPDLPKDEVIKKPNFGETSGILKVVPSPRLRER